MAQTCRFPDGSIDPAGVPCGNFNNYSNCCSVGGACMNDTPFCLWLFDWQVDRMSFTYSGGDLKDETLVPCQKESPHGRADMTPCPPNSDASITYCCAQTIECCPNQRNANNISSYTLDNSKPGALLAVSAAAGASTSTPDPMATSTATIVSATASCPLTTGNGSKDTPIGVIVGGVIGGAAILALAAFLLFIGSRMRWFSRKRKGSVRDRKVVKDEFQPRHELDNVDVRYEMAGESHRQ